MASTLVFVVMHAILSTIHRIVMSCVHTTQSHLFLARDEDCATTEVVQGGASLDCGVQIVTRSAQEVNSRRAL